MSKSMQQRWFHIQISCIHIIHLLHRPHAQQFLSIFTFHDHQMGYTSVTEDEQSLVFQTRK
jgi:hypothetical protein